MAPELPAPVACRICPAKVRWMETLRGSRIPLELTPDSQGPWVLVEDDTARAGWLAVPFRTLVHAEALRYRSHLDRCRPAREEGPPMPLLAPKADPTAGLKFPRRRVEEVRLR
jgi:hypothetical protein